MTLALPNGLISVRTNNCTFCNYFFLFIKNTIKLVTWTSGHIKFTNRIIYFSFKDSEYSIELNSAFSTKSTSYPPISLFTPLTSSNVGLSESVVSFSSFSSLLLSFSSSTVSFTHSFISTVEMSSGHYSITLFKASWLFYLSYSVISLCISP